MDGSGGLPPPPDLVQGGGGGTTLPDGSELGPYAHLERDACAHLGLLVSSFHAKTWWYEVLDLTRKLLLNGLLLFVGRGSAGQVRTTHPEEMLS